MQTDSMCAWIEGTDQEGRICAQREADGRAASSISGPCDREASLRCAIARRGSYHQRDRSQRGGRFLLSGEKRIPVRSRVSTGPPPERVPRSPAGQSALRLGRRRPGGSFHDSPGTARSEARIRGRRFPTRCWEAIQATSGTAAFVAVTSTGSFARCTRGELAPRIGGRRRSPPSCTGDRKTAGVLLQKIRDDKGTRCWFATVIRSGEGRRHVRADLRLSKTYHHAALQFRGYPTEPAFSSGGRGPAAHRSGGAASVRGVSVPQALSKFRRASGGTAHRHPHPDRGIPRRPSTQEPYATWCAAGYGRASFSPLFRRARRKRDIMRTSSLAAKGSFLKWKGKKAF